MQSIVGLRVGAGVWFLDSVRRKWKRTDNGTLILGRYANTNS